MDSLFLFFFFYFETFVPQSVAFVRLPPPQPPHQTSAGFLLVETDLRLKSSQNEIELRFLYLSFFFGVKENRSSFIVVVVVVVWPRFLLFLDGFFFKKRK